jgi:hypothetical protein
MAKNNRDFTTKECRGVMTYLFPRRNLSKKIYDMLVIFSDERPSYSTVKNWDARFGTGYVSTGDDERSGSPTQVIIPENVDAIHSMILDDQRISTKKIAKTLTITRERVDYIIHEILDMRQLSDKWVPRCLNASQKCD